MITVGIVVAEPSGDILAAGLMQALKDLIPGVRFEGVAGPKMEAVGIDCWESMDSLSVMGLVEVLKHLPRLLKLRKSLFQRWSKKPPDLFIGVDGPDFNLTLETKLKDQGIPTVHYVCPTVWAWRQNRVKKIQKAADLVLSIFPFEKPFLAKHGIDSEYVGHSLAESMPLDVDVLAARKKLGIDSEKPVLAILPGSRMSEVQGLSRPFLQTAAACKTEIDQLQFVTPLANEKTAALYREQAKQYLPDTEIKITIGDTKTCLAAADAALVASGTATFEALLSKCPMVVGYKVQGFTYFLLRKLGMLKTEHVSMANLLSDTPLALELLQEKCEPEYLTPALLPMLGDEQRIASIREHYRDVHAKLRTNTNESAAHAVFSLMKERSIV